MEIELWSGSTKAIVDPMGAWLTNLSDDNGDILFPKRSFKVDDVAKDRGGLFVCAPNFGPGGSSGLAQHGFARTQAWEVVDKTENSVLLRLISQDGDYKDVSFVVSYQLNDKGLIATLDIANDSEREVRVAPAFHPYFATQESTVKVNGEAQDLSELHEAVFTEGQRQELEIAGRMMTLESKELTTWVKWTDELGPYICVESSLAGFAFEDDTPGDKELLGSGETSTYSCTMSWRQK
jgi:D-hexose-6-phosphate mutarotase